MSLIFKGIYLGGSGGGSANLTTLDVTPMTNYQSISPEEGYDGFSLVNVSAVNSSIDPNITASNIVNGVNILGVVGTASASAPKEVARYVIDENGIASPNDRDLTGCFDDIKGVHADAFRNAFVSMNVSGDVSFPNVNVINEASAFYGAFQYTNINSLSFQNLVIADTGGVNSSIFLQVAAHTNLKSINFDKLETAGASCFASAFTDTLLEEINFPNLVNIRNSCFSSIYTGFDWQSYSLKSFSAPNIRYIPYGAFSYAFNGVKSLTTFDINVNAGVDTSSHNAFNKAFGSTGLTNFTLLNVSMIGENTFYQTFYNSHNLTNVVLKGETPFNISTYGSNSFYGFCQNCSNLSDVTLDVRETNDTTSTSSRGAFNNAFLNCYNLVNVNMHYLRQLGYNTLNSTFRNCTNLTYFSFDHLYSTKRSSLTNTFAYSGMQNLYFPSVNNAQVSNFGTGMLSGVNDCIVHFPNSFNRISTWADVLAGFGGTNTTILFDLPSVTNSFANFYNITGNGEMGGYTFAVNASSESANAWQAMNDISTGWHSAVAEAPHWFEWYCPGSMLIDEIDYVISSFVNTISNRVSFINMCVSNDGTNWNEINAYQDSAFIIKIRKPDYYKYYRMYFNSYANDPNNLVTINSMNIYGMYKYTE